MKSRLFWVLAGLLLMSCPGPKNEDNNEETIARELIGKWEINKIIDAHTEFDFPFYERYSGGYEFTADNVTEYRNESIYSSTTGMYSKKNILYSQTGEKTYAYSIRNNTLTFTALSNHWGGIAKKVKMFSWEGPNKDIHPELKIVEGFNFDNYPKVDGSTSTYPLNVLLACKLVGTNYAWNSDSDGLRSISPVLKSEYNAKKFRERIKGSQTHQSFINLIDKQTDFILSARKMSPDEKAYAAAAGVSLIETPVALDALVFIVNPRNPIDSLTITQIQDIYTGKITDWNEVGWENNAPSIKPYVRNANSGSQELMESLVMKDLDIADLPVNGPELIIFTMTGAFDAVFHEVNAICFTIYYYKERMITGVDVKGLAVNGIYPNKETIGDRSYPYAAEVYAVIRSDLDKSSTAYKLYELIQTKIGKEIISESGYVPTS